MNYVTTTVQVCINCKLTTVHVCVNCKLTTVHVCIYILFAVCADDGDCQNLLQTFNNTNKNLCDEPKLKYFCNESCGLCQHVAGTFIYSRNMVTMNVCCLELLFITITMLLNTSVCLYQMIFLSRMIWYRELLVITNSLLLRMLV